MNYSSPQSDGFSMLKSSVAVAVVQSTAARPPLHAREKTPAVASVQSPVGLPVSRRNRRKFGSLQSPAGMSPPGALR